MDHFKHIYTQRAADYHQMIIPEDMYGNLLSTLQAVTPLQGKRVLDLGTGTGRLPLLLADQTASMVGLDLYGDMLRENRRQCSRVDGQWALIQGDMQALPFPQAWAEVVVAGWAIGHMRFWFASAWQTHIGQVLREMHRVVTPGGMLIILETLTTGSLTPAPPAPELAEYYGWLEEVWGFNRQMIRTDYNFATVQEAVERTEFFFGPELAASIRDNGWAQLPEWTGVWSKQV